MEIRTLYARERLGLAAMLDAWPLAEGWSAGDRLRALIEYEPSWSDDSTGEGYVHPKWGSIGNGRYVKPENILADITRVNTFRKVVIHAIAVGKDANMDMMEKLAEQNHGKYINRG